MADPRELSARQHGISSSKARCDDCRAAVGSIVCTCPEAASTGKDSRLRWSEEAIGQVVVELWLAVRWMVERKVGGIVLTP